MGSKRAEQHIPSFAQEIVRQYNSKGEVDARLQLQPGKSGAAGSSSSR
jgi:7-hydroxymethyl chlorophyll a reductase